MPAKGKAYWDKKLIGNGGVLNEYVKWRDSVDTTEDGKPIAACVTCDKLVSGVNLQAGHWIGRRHKGVAYDEHNLHAQCSYCNKWGNGEPQKYEIFLRAEYGNEEVERLLSHLGKPRHWTPQELENLYNEYKEMLKEVKHG